MVNSALDLLILVAGLVYARNVRTVQLGYIAMMVVQAIVETVPWDNIVPAVPQRVQLPLRDAMEVAALVLTRILVRINVNRVNIA